MKQPLVNKIFQIYYDLYGYDIEAILLRSGLTHIGQMDIVFGPDFNYFLKDETMKNE